ncbi:pilus assembly protein CpaF [Aliidiomarina iranensis]|uniref:Pilus assembly protein CpaF n=1 Tax=Aliidiomarina iranensis TaxID=1434071 RepID=A0A432VXF0_9GAMM|nr:CpaF family protein [Aliidiomarina iranensis]RUO21245.1 pilus assembly protein CpaF [Aliidiomarina iranensis]
MDFANFADAERSRYQRLLENTLKAVNIHHTDVDLLSDTELREVVATVIRKELKRESIDIQSVNEEVLIQSAIDDLVGLGPIENLLRDPDVTEIMLNRFNQVFIERRGSLTLSPYSFRDEQAVRRVIERIVTPLGRRIDESVPMVDARLPNGARVNAVIPPLAVDGACLTIRKFAINRLTMANLQDSGSVSPELAKLLMSAVRCRQNMLICGGTGSGKTTLLNILADFIPEHERIITIEDAAELQLQHANLVRLEARPANQEGEGAVSIRQLVINALRMRPDRIVVGECRAGESLDMLQAMNTGHDGSLTTLHANTPRDALRRLETMVLMAGIEIPMSAIRQQIMGAVKLLVQITRLANGKRVVSSLAELQGNDGDVLQLAELVRYNTETESHEVTGQVPRFIDQLPESEREKILAELNQANAFAF